MPSIIRSVIHYSQKCTNGGWSLSLNTFTESQTKQSNLVFFPHRLFVGYVCQINNINDIWTEARTTHRHLILYINGMALTNAWKLLISHNQMISSYKATWENLIIVIMRLLSKGNYVKLSSIQSAPKVLWYQQCCRMKNELVVLVISLEYKKIS